MSGSEQTLTVRRWHAGRGFGFATTEDGQDALLHINTLNRAGLTAPSVGARVTGRVETNERGRKFTVVSCIEPPLVAATTPSAHVLSLEVQPARVKWFDAEAGYGFVRTFGAPLEDVFLHVSVLDASGVAPPASGEAIKVRVTEGPRGPVTAQVLPWEAAHD